MKNQIIIDPKYLIYRDRKELYEHINELFKINKDQFDMKSELVKAISLFEKIFKEVMTEFPSRARNEMYDTNVLCRKIKEKGSCLICPITDPETADCNFVRCIRHATGKDFYKHIYHLKSVEISKLYSFYKSLVAYSKYAKLRQL